MKPVDPVTSVFKQSFPSSVMMAAGRGSPQWRYLGVRGVQQLTAVRAADLGDREVVALAVADLGGRSFRHRPRVSPGADGEQDVAQLPSFGGQDVVEPLRSLGICPPEDDLVADQPVKAQ